MLKDWETEDDEAQVPTRPTTPPKLGYEVKAYLVLVDSDKYNDWGIIEDTLNNLNWQPGMGETVGTWSRPGYDNSIHISLGTALSALQDRSIQSFAKYAEERRQEQLGVKPARKARKTGVPIPEPEQVQELSVDEKLKFNSLRAKLGRAK